MYTRFEVRYRSMRWRSILAVTVAVIFSVAAPGSAEYQSANSDRFGLDGSSSPISEPHIVSSFLDLCDGEWMLSPQGYTPNFITGDEYFVTYQDPSVLGCTSTYPFGVTEINWHIRVHDSTGFDVRPVIFDADLSGCEAPSSFIRIGDPQHFSFPVAGSYLISLPLGDTCCVDGPYFAGVYVDGAIGAGVIDPESDGEPPEDCWNYHAYDGGNWVDIENTSINSNLCLYSVGYNSLQNLCQQLPPVCTPVGEFELGTKLYDNLGTLIDIGIYPVQDFVDIDADDDLDLFIGEWWGEIWFYENVGTPENHSLELITTSYASIDVGRSSAPSFVDIDGDGDQDLFIGSNYTVGYGDGDMWYYENVGSPDSPSFTLVSSNYLSLINTGIGKPEFVDIDGDDDYDLLFGYEESYPDGEYGIVFYRNDGTKYSPSWTLVTTTYLDLPSEYIVQYYVCFEDLDCDGDFDLLLDRGTMPPNLTYYRNDGDATTPAWVLETHDFHSLGEYLLGNNNVPSFADINGDDVSDLTLGIGNSDFDDEEGVVLYFLGHEQVKGDMDGSGEVDIDDVVYLIACIFQGGDCPEDYVGDADCSSAYDIDDVVYLINYIFGGGPPPGDPNNDGVPDC